MKDRIFAHANPDGFSVPTLARYHFGGEKRNVTLEHSSDATVGTKASNTYRIPFNGTLSMNDTTDCDGDPHFMLTIDGRLTEFLHRRPYALQVVAWFELETAHTEELCDRTSTTIPSWNQEDPSESDKLTFGEFQARIAAALPLAKVVKSISLCNWTRKAYLFENLPHWLDKCYSLYENIAERTAYAAQKYRDPSKSRTNTLHCDLQLKNRFRGAVSLNSIQFAGRFEDRPPAGTKGRFFYELAYWQTKTEFGEFGKELLRRRERARGSTKHQGCYVFGGHVEARERHTCYIRSIIAVWYYSSAAAAAFSSFSHQGTYVING